MPRLSPKTAQDAKLLDPLTFEFLQSKVNTRAAIQSDTAWNVTKAQQAGVKTLYYEVHIIALERGGGVGVGIATAGFPLSDAQPGWKKGSYGYHGDDGMKFIEANQTTKFGPKFGQDDIIGSGIDTHSGDLFFTKNGSLIGVAAVVDKSAQYFPTVGLNKKGKLKFNFDGPFKYQVAASNPTPTAIQPAEAKEKAPEVPQQKVEETIEKVEEKIPQAETAVAVVPSIPIPIPDSKPELVPAPSTPATQKWSGKPKEHIMISYQWGSQEFVKQIYKELTARGLVVWMDIEGGMRGDIYQSMAEGVEGAVLFIPVLTSKYMASPNCRRECTAAADMRKTFIPLMCETFEISGWLRACIPGRLWYPCFDHKMSPETLNDFITAVLAEIPANSPARKPNLSVYISYSFKNRGQAELIRKKLEEDKPPYECIMSHADEKNQEADGKNGKLKKSAVLEEKLRNAKAVILIITNEFEASDECKNDVSLCYSYRKVIIPILARHSKAYPPKGMEFALRGINYLDFSSMFSNPAKHSTIQRKLSDALASGAVTASAAPVQHARNFRIKTVGQWSEEDVCNWLFHIGLSQYGNDFKKKHVNGRVLLSLTEKDLDLLKVMKLHQRRFVAAISDLFNGLNWNEDEVSEWMESVGLGELTQNLYEAHINGQSLLMLSENDLQGNRIEDPVTQKRLLLEIQHLKETMARVPIQDELYRFKVLRNVLKPIPTDAKDDFKFSAEIVELLKHLYAACDPEQQGFTQAALKKFLLVLLILAGIYRDTYPTKNIWNDMNVVEMLCLKSLSNEMLDDIDNIVTNIDEMIKKGEIEEIRELMENKIVAFMSFYYVILNNILQRLFSIVDRQVDGVVSWNELIPSLELLIHGSTDDKFKLAMCLVDFNGDGDISQQEFLDFYHECFLPVVKFSKLSGVLKQNEQLNKDSFLYVAYESVKDKIDQFPSLLNKNFAVEEFGGYLAEQHDDPDLVLNVPWDNSPFIWYPYGYHYHELIFKEKSSYPDGTYGCDACGEFKETGAVYNCPTCQFDLCPDCHAKRSSEPARNIDILLRYKSSTFTLTNIAIGGKFNCPPIMLAKSALVWLTEDKPNLETYKKFNNFTQDQVDAYSGTDKPLFVAIDPKDKYIKYVNFEQPRPGKFVLIKLLDTFTEEEIQAAKEEKRAAKQKLEEEKKNEAGENEENENEENENEENENDGEEAIDETQQKEDQQEENEDEEAKAANELAKKCIVSEFIGLWGFDGQKKSHKIESDAKKLFSALVARYDTMGSAYDDDENEQNEEDDLKMNKYVTEFLKSARDMANGVDELSPAAIEENIAKKDVEELLSRLSYLSTVGENPANILILILPIIHLFRLFYGHNVYDILKKPM